MLGAAAGHGRGRAWCRSRPPTRCSPPAAPTTSCAWTSPSPASTSTSSARLPGLTTGYGPSHQATEDLAILRGLPEPDDRRPVRLGRHRAGRPAARRAPRPDLPAAAARQRARGARRVRLPVRARQGRRAPQRPRRRDHLHRADDHARAAGRGAAGGRPRRRRGAARARRSSRWTATRSCAPPRPAGSSSPARTTPWSAGSPSPSPRTLAFAGAGTRVVPIALPDEFLAAGALPTLHDRYGLSTDAVVARIKSEL